MRFCPLSWCEHIVEVCPGHSSAANHLLLVELSQGHSSGTIFCNNANDCCTVKVTSSSDGGISYLLQLLSITLFAYFADSEANKVIFSLFWGLFYGCNMFGPKTSTWFHVSIFVIASWQNLLPKQWNVKHYYFYIHTLSWQVSQRLAQLAHCRPPSPQVVAAADLEQILLHLLERCFSPLVVQIHFCSKPLKIVASSTTWSLQKKIGN